ncbi:TIGR02300 family protein [Ahrensia kielensis]|uniref:TIGR02300 family protein n=1 Tax=Ahrensia kielensis TaxID=76980 RepID=A0ABU9T9E3_9HYPH|nr:TIGR02300 family protein [Ahrensia kielensis]
MAKAELGTKRTCPETDKKFYDLNKDPVVSPYTGKSYPLSFFDLPTGPSRAKPAPPIKAVQPASVEDEDEDDLELEGADVVSLEDADEDETGADDAKNMPDLGDNTDDDIEDVDIDDDDDDDTFLAADDDDDDDDVTGIVNVSGDDDDDS